jgi:hypothetical protein
VVAVTIFSVLTRHQGISLSVCMTVYSVLDTPVSRVNTPAIHDVDISISSVLRSRLDRYVIQHSVTVAGQTACVGTKSQEQTVTSRLRLKQDSSA